MKELLQETNKLIKRVKRLIVAEVAAIAIFTLFIISCCCMNEWGTAVFVLVCCCPMVHITSKSFELLDDLYGDKARMEFCIEQLGWDDEKA